MEPSMFGMPGQFLGDPHPALSPPDKWMITTMITRTMNDRRPHSVRRFPGPFIAGEGIDIDRLWLRAQFWSQSWKMLQERARGGGGLLEGGEPAPGDWLSHLRQNWPGVLVLAYQVIDYGSGEVISSIEPERQTSYLSCVQVDDYSLILFTWNSEMFSHSIWVETISCAEALIRAFSGFRLKSSQDRYLQC